MNHFGPLCYLLPLHMPVRLVEEICILDHLSGGRFEVGIGRGIVPFELMYAGVDPNKAKTMFEESLGEIRHKQERHPGQHEAILTRELWERVQQRLNGNSARSRGSANRSISSPLAGKLFDADRQPLYVQGATKGRRRYRYYVSKCLVKGSARDNEKGWRLSAPEVERAVAIAARQILSNRASLLEALEKSGIDSPDVTATLESVSSLVKRQQNDADASACLVDIVDSAELRDNGISITLRIEVPCSRAGIRTSSILNLSRFVPLKLKRRGVETRIIIAGGDDLAANDRPGVAQGSGAFESVV